MKIILSLLCMFLLLPTIAFSSTEYLVLNGIPMVQSKGNIQQSENVSLTESQQNEYRLLITKNGDDYFWTSRENRPLIKMQSGADSSLRGMIRLGDSFFTLHSTPPKPHLTSNIPVYPDVLDSSKNTCLIYP